MNQIRWSRVLLAVLAVVLVGVVVWQFLTAPSGPSKPPTDQIQLRLMQSSDPRVIVAEVTNPDRNIRRTAIHRLGQLGPQAAAVVPELVRAYVGSQDPDTKRELWDVVERLGSVAVPGLLEAFRQEPGSRLAVTAWLTAIGPSGRDAALVLADGAGNTSAEVRRQSLAALVRMGREADPACPAVLAALRAATARLPDKRAAEEVTLALGVLSAIGPDSPAVRVAAADLSTLLTANPEPDLRRKGLQLLAAMGPNEIRVAVPGLLTVLRRHLDHPEAALPVRRSEPTLVELSLAALAKAEQLPPDALPLFVRLTATNRRETVALLKKVGPPALEHYRRALRGAPAEQRAALRVLREWGDGAEAAAPEVVALLADPEPAVRADALTTAVALGVADSAVLAVLERHLFEGSDEEAAGAKDHLVKLGEKAKGLVPRMRDQLAQVPAARRRVLLALLPKLDPGTAGVVSGYLTVDNAKDRAAARAGLAGVHLPLETYRAVLDHPDPDHRAWAATELSRSKHPHDTIVTELLVAWVLDPSDRVRDDLSALLHGHLNIQGPFAHWGRNECPGQGGLQTLPPAAVKAVPRLIAVLRNPPSRNAANYQIDPFSLPLRGRDPWLPSVADKALGKRRPPPTQEQLAETARKDAEHQAAVQEATARYVRSLIRSRAIEALGHIGPAASDATDALLEVLDDTTRVERHSRGSTGLNPKVQRRPVADFAARALVAVDRDAAEKLPELKAYLNAKAQTEAETQRREQEAKRAAGEAKIKAQREAADRLSASLAAAKNADEKVKAIRADGFQAGLFGARTLVAALADGGRVADWAEVTLCRLGADGEITERDLSDPDSTTPLLNGGKYREEPPLVKVAKDRVKQAIKRKSYNIPLFLSDE